MCEHVVFRVGARAIGKVWTYPKWKREIVYNYSLNKNTWDTSTQRRFFQFLPVSSSSQCCLSQLTHQILHTNIGTARRQQSVPTILTETEA